MPWFNFSFHDFAFAFLSVLFEGVPFLLLGSVVSGIIDVFVSSERITKMLPRGSGAAIFLSGLFGLIFPMCECGSVIIIRRFLRKGVPLSCAATYMLAAPIVSPIVALSTWQAYSQSAQGPLCMTALRLGLGFAISIGVGFLIQSVPRERILQPAMTGSVSLRRRAGLSVAAAPEKEELDFSERVASSSLTKKLLLAAQSATADFLDVAFFFVIGVAITSVFNTGVNQESLAPLAASPMLAILSLMALAALLALCSTTDAFVAWTFTATGFPAAAQLAFLVFGPMFDLKLFWLYSLIFKKRFVAFFAVALFILIALLCWRLDALQLLPRTANVRRPS
jgi:uncharacterized membrane protein YraQ (UPF0718 family)